MPTKTKYIIVAVAALAVAAALLLHRTDPKEAYIAGMRTENGGNYSLVQQYGGRFDSCGRVKAISADTGRQFDGLVCCNDSDQCDLRWEW